MAVVQMPTPISSAGEVFRQLTYKFHMRTYLTKSPFCSCGYLFQWRCELVSTGSFSSRISRGKMLGCPFYKLGQRGTTATLHHRGQAGLGMAQALLPGQSPQASTRRRCTAQQRIGLMCMHWSRAPRGPDMRQPQRSGNIGGKHQLSKISALQLVITITLLQGSPRASPPPGRASPQHPPLAFMQPHIPLFHRTQERAFPLLPRQHLQAGLLLFHSFL